MPRCLDMALACSLLACSPAPQPSPTPPPAAPIHAPSPPVADPPGSTTDPTSPSPAQLPSRGPRSTGSKLIVVSFISIGQGTDSDANDELKQLLSKYDPDGKIMRQTHHWGKEGEHDECLDTETLTAAQRAGLLRELRSRFGDNQMVKIEERDVCLR